MMEESSVSSSDDQILSSQPATGPAGSLFEGRVGAYYLLSMLAGGEPRGLPGTAATQIEFQRASDRPLDDVIVHAADTQGKPAVLEVQVKRTVDFTASDPVFRALVAQLAKAAAKPEFDVQCCELAIAIRLLDALMRLGVATVRSVEERLAEVRRTYLKSVSPVL